MKDVPGWKVNFFVVIPTPIFVLVKGMKCNKQNPNPTPPHPKKNEPGGPDVCMNVLYLKSQTRSVHNGTE